MTSANSPLTLNPSQITRNSHGQTPLHIAARGGKTNEIQRLLKLGHKAEVQDLDGRTPLHLTAIQGNIEAAKVLLEEGSADPLALTYEKESSFHLAASAGDLGLIQLFNKQTSLHSWLEVSDSDGKTPLHHSVWLAPKPKLVAYLLSQGANVKACNNFGYTALHWAAKYGHAKSVCYLLKTGADLSIKNANGDTPLDLAIRWGQDEIVHLLLNWDGQSTTIKKTSSSSSSNNNTTPTRTSAFQIGEQLEQYRKLKRGSDPEGAAYHLFEEAHESGKLLKQVFWLDRLAQIYIDKAEYLQAAHLLNGALALVEDSGISSKKGNKPLDKQKSSSSSSSSSQGIIDSDSAGDLASERTMLSIKIQPGSADNQINPGYTTFLLSKLERIERLFLYEKTRKNLPIFYCGQLARHRETLKGIRSGAERRLKGKVSSERLRHFISNSLQSLFCDLVRECITWIQEQPPKGFAIIALGSMARIEAAPYSDMEYAFLLGLNSRKDVEYAKLLDELLTLKIINMGETRFDLLRSKRVKQVMRHARSLTPSGFSADKGGLIPSGRQQIYKLIGTPEELASYQTAEWLQRNESEVILVNAMTTVRCLMGADQLVSDYLKRIGKILDGKSLSDSSSGILRRSRALKLIKGHLEEFKPRLDTSKLFGRDARGFGVKKELYRPIESMIAGLSLYYGVHATSTAGRIEELRRKRVLSETGAKELQGAADRAYRFRVSTHLFYRTEKEILYMEEESNNRNSDGLFVVTKEIKRDIEGIYRVLIPLYAAALNFCNGDEKAFFRSSLYDSEIGDGRAIDHNAMSLQRNALLALSQAALNPNNTGSLWDLSRNQEDCGEAQLALKSRLEILERLKKKHKKEPHRNTACNLNLIGAAYCNLGEYGKAIRYSKEALEMQQQIFGHRPSEDLAMTLTQLGIIYKRMGNCKKALEYHQASLQIKCFLDPKMDQLSHAIGLINCGNSLLGLARYREALQIMRKGLQCFQGIYKNKPHWHVSAALLNIGAVYLELGEYQKALPYYRKALQMDSRIYKGLSHPNLLIDWNNLGTVYVELGKTDEAMKCSSAALKIGHELYQDKPHSNVAATLSLLGNIYDERDDLWEAKSSYEKSLKMSREICQNNDHPSVALSLNQLGLVYARIGLLSEAIQCHLQSLEMRRAIYNNEPHTDIAMSLNNLGMAYYNLGIFEDKNQNIAKAIACHQESMKINLLVYKRDNHPNIGRNLGQLACSYAGGGRYKEAIQYGTQAHTLFKTIYGSSHHLTQRAASDLARFKKLRASTL